MVNIFFWYVSSASVPSGWTEISSTYRDRLVCVTGSLTTGGVSTHSHSLGSWTVGTNKTESCIQSSVGYTTTVRQSHNHSVSSSSVAEASSFPSAKAYRLIYKNYNDFVGLLPADVAVTKTSTPGASWTEVDNGLSYFFYIGDAEDVGAVYGSNEHYHNVSVALSSGTYNVYQRPSGSTPYGDYQHGHNSIDIASSVFNNYDFKHVGATKLWKTTGTTYTLPAGCYAYFDDTVPSGWTEITDTNSFHYKSTGTTFISASGNNELACAHSHTLSGDSNIPSLNVGSGTGSGTANPSNHVHTLSVDLGSSSMAPPYTRLRIAYNNSDISYSSTITKDYTMNMLLQKTRTASNNMDVILKAVRNKTVTADTILKKTRSVSFGEDLLLSKTISKNHALNVLLRKTVIASITANLQLKKTREASYDLSAVVQKTISKGYSAGLEIIALSRYLSYEMGLSLVNRRMASLDMDVMLKATRTAGSSFNMISIQRREAAYTLNALLQGKKDKTAEFDVILKKIGTTPYSLDVLLKKSRVSTYQTSVRLQAQLQKSYLTDLLARIRRTSSADFDAILIQRREEGYDLATTLKAIRTSDLTINTILKKKMASSVNMSIGLQKAVTSAYTFDMLTKKYGVTASYQMKTFLFQPQRKSVSMSLLVRDTLETNALFDVLIAGRYDKDYLMNILLEKTQAKTYSMSSLLQGVRETSIEADVWLKKPQDTAQDMDVLLQKAKTTAIYANAMLQKSISKDYSVDTLIARRRVAGYNTDVLLRARKTAGYGVDTLIAGRMSKSYTLNAKVARTTSKTYLSRLYLKRRGIAQGFDMSALMVVRSLSAYTMRYSGAKSVNYGVNFNLAIIRPRSYDNKRDLPIKRVPEVVSVGSDYVPVYDIPEVEIRPFPEKEAERIEPEGSDYINADLPEGEKKIRPFKKTI